MALPTFWTTAEIKRLDGFLMQEEGPENTMGAAMLDGYLCAVVSGPRLILPSEMMRWVWDTEQGQDGPVFKNQAQADRIYGLIMRQWNAINDALTHDPASYEPLVCERKVEGRTIPIIDEWCMGYHKGIAIDMENWMPLLIGQPGLLSNVLLYGTEDGWDALKAKKLSAAEHQAVADSLGDVARAAHAFWFTQRQQQAATGTLPEPVRRRETVRREGPKIGRNDPCPCGSGRKYKQCHGAG
jgi:uncharacterized protein